MGIKLFFSWWKTNFKSHMTSMRKNVTCTDIGVEIDNLMIDMNGVFHNSAQKIYQYGNYKPKPTSFSKDRVRYKLSARKIQLKVFEDVCKEIEHLLDVAQPKKRLILCVDGPAPLAKQCQQRQRRFRSAMESDSKCAFDSNCLTPGTQFMDYLSKYIHWYILKKISTDPKWQKLDIIFSNEKAVGEGEFKILQYIRYYGNPLETYCINGMDADLIMLSLGTHLPNFYILREDLYDFSNEYYCINIGASREKLVEIMKWDSDRFAFDAKTAIDDFIFLCFMVGNDFLPHIPSIEIIENGIELIIEVYKEVCTSYGHITNTHSTNIKFSKDSLGIFLATIGSREKDMFEEKLSHKASFFPDPLIESCAKMINNRKFDLDIDKYREKYSQHYFPPEVSMEQICHSYLEGMQWVISYYTQGVPNWKWIYKYHYAPPAFILAQYMNSFVFPTYGRTTPTTPFQQLLSVLPPKSAKLIPEPLAKLLTDKKSLLAPYCPDKFGIDLAGKRKEWEGIALLPFVDFQTVLDVYDENIQNVEEQDLKRNISGRSFVYTYTPNNTSMFKSYYGDIHECSVKTTCIDL